MVKVRLSLGQGQTISMPLDLSWNVILYGCNVIKLGYIKKPNEIRT